MPQPAAFLTPEIDTTSRGHLRFDIGELVDACLDQTADALLLTGAAGGGDVSCAMEAVRTARGQGRPLDLIEVIARLQSQKGEWLGGVIEALGDRLATTLNPSPQLIPFAGRLIAPYAFYQSYDHLHKLAKALLVPVIFAEVTGSIGVGSTNPIAATILAAKIQELVAQRFDIRPSLTIARLDYGSWTLLTHRHFEL
jgi:hypothetical protein